MREPIDVARRMFCLDMLQHRREAEDAFLKARTDAEMAAREEDLEAMIAFLKESGLDEWMSEEEVEAFDTPLGEMKEEQYVDATWRVESLAVMAWALGMLPDLPEFDVSVTGEELTEVIDIDRWREVTERAELRSSDEIAMARDSAALWDWRAQVGTPPYESDGDESEIIEECRVALAAGLVPRLVRNDLPVRGMPYHEIDEETSRRTGQHRSGEALCAQLALWLFGGLGQRTDR